MTQVPNGGMSDPAAQVQAPGLALTVLSIIYIVFAVFSLVMNLAFGGLGALGAVGQQRMNMEFQGISGVIGAVIGIIFGVIILLGALKMRRLQSYPLAMTSAILAMLPCSCCCIAGLPLGIWALVVLLKPEVKAAFQ